MRRAQTPVLVVTIVLLLVAASPAAACPMCFGAAAGSKAAGAMNNAILFLLALVCLVQIGFATLFYNWWRRSRELARKPKPFVLADGGVS